MSRVKEIIRLEQEGDDLEEGASQKRWRAAELIHDELEDGTLTAIGLGREIGKSAQHVLYMRRSWQQALKLKAAGQPLPKFHIMYSSSEVRGENSGTYQAAAGGTTWVKRGTAQAEIPMADKDVFEPGSGRDLYGEPGDGEDEFQPLSPGETAHTWVAAADEATRLLAEHRATLRFLSDEDLRVLEEVEERLIALNEELARS